MGSSNSAPGDPPAGGELVRSPEFQRALVRGEDWRALAETRGVDVLRLEDEFATDLRALDFARRRRDGETLEQIGRSTLPRPLTRERVRQILGRLLPDLPPDLAAEVRDAGAALADRRTVAQRRMVVEEVIASPGISLAGLAEVLDLPAGTVQRHLGPLASKFVRGTRVAHTWAERRFTDEELLEVLREASLFVAPFSGKGYDEAVAQGFVDGPSRATIINRFGSWNAACEAAGIEPNEPWRDEYERRWSRRELVDVVVRFLMSDAPSRSLGSYERWRVDRAAEGADEPSISLLRIRLGGWQAVIERALDRIAEQGPLDRHAGLAARLRDEASGRE